MRIFLPLVVMIVVCLALLTACGPAAVEEGPELEPCDLGGRVSAACGHIRVPENWEEEGGREIEVHFAVIRAESSLPEPDAVFLLAGGPGQSAMETYPLVLSFLNDLNGKRDIVLVDQRGTGRSNGLACDEVLALTLESSEADGLAAVQACRERLAGEHDLAQYTTDVAMRDLDAVRAALGYETINVIGTSYGSRAALRYMDLFGERVRSVVLNSVVSHNLVLQLQAPVDGQRALEMLFDRCAQDVACSERFPDFEEQFATVREGLAGGQEVVFRHPLQGTRERLEMDEEAFMRGIFTLLYSAELTSLLPLMIDEIAETGDYGPLVGQIAALSASLGTYQGMFFAVVCSEDAPLLDLQEAEALNEGGLFPLVADDLLAQCEGWPRATVADDFRAALQSDIPTLLLSGDADPITPPQYAEEVAEGLGNSRMVTLPGYGHDVLIAGCMPAVVTSFVETADVQGLDASCLEEVTPPPFFVTLAGPRP